MNDCRLAAMPLSPGTRTLENFRASQQRNQSTVNAMEMLCTQVSYEKASIVKVEFAAHLFSTKDWRHQPKQAELDSASSSSRAMTTLRKARSDGVAIQRRDVWKQWSGVEEKECEAEHRPNVQTPNPSPSSVKYSSLKTI